MMILFNNRYIRAPHFGQIAMVAFIGVCIAFSFSIVLWAVEEEMVNLVNPRHDVVKAVDVLEQQEIEYDSQGNWVLVEKGQFIRAKMALKNVGINVTSTDSAMTGAQMAAITEGHVVQDKAVSGKDAQQSKSLYLKPWFMKLLRLGMATFVILIMIFVVMRPMRRDLIKWSAAIDKQKHHALDTPQDWSALNDVTASNEKTEQTDSTRQATLIVALVICLGFAFSIISWASAPEMSPLMDDLKVAHSAKVKDALDQNKIHYMLDLDHGRLSVDKEKRSLARIALAKVGFVLEYPQYKGKVSVPKVEHKTDTLLPIYQQSWFFSFARLMAAALVIITLILVVIRPLYRALIGPDYYVDKASVG